MEPLLTFDELATKLKELIADMDLPSQRKTLSCEGEYDVYWLKRNMVIRNSKHYNYELALGVLQRMIRSLQSKEFLLDCVTGTGSAYYDEKSC